MSRIREIPLFRIGAESAAIVASILLAFAIDAWWDERKEASLEQELLAALLIEFKQNVNLLRSASENYETQYLDARNLLVYLDANSEQRNSAELERLVRSLWDARSVHLETGAYEAAAASGILRLISDNELRSHLAAWPSYVAEWAEEEDALFLYRKNFLNPYMWGKIRTRTIAPDYASFPDGQSPPLIPRAGLDKDALIDSIASVEFDNLVTKRAQNTWFALRDCETLISKATRIISLIQTSLDGQR
ncbi:MAG: hypothetical protein ACI88G_001276 [Woeseiaceae bacterium]|jgi:hypothetical protein